MSKRDEPRIEALRAIDDLVKIQQQMVRQWSSSALAVLGRLQTGSFDAGIWVDVYGRAVSEAADALERSLDVVAKRRGRW